METANEIRKICIDNDEEWFLTHSSTRISLVYLECDGEWERAQLDTERMASSIYYRYYEACFSEGEMLLMPHGDKENCYHIEFTCVEKYAEQNSKDFEAEP
jgi:hypothetical protein